MKLYIKNKTTFFWVLLAGLMFFSIKGFAAEVETVAIEAALKQQWDKPGQPLSVPVVIVRGDYAIADWVQAPRGGRALLKRDAHRWQTLLCGDIQLTEKRHLVDAGVPAVDAEYLSMALAQAEGSVSDADKTLINSFKGIVDLLKEPRHHAH